MKNLLKELDSDELGNFYICIVGQICKTGEEIISKELFLSHYQAYIEGLQNGKLIDEAIYRSSFSSVFTTTLDDVYKVKVSDDQFILRVSKPVLQLQMHRMHFSAFDDSFRPMIFGKESIFWGIQFSYPQIYQDNQTKEIINVLSQNGFENKKLYHALQKWIRKNTIPTPFMYEGKLINAPIRIGKKCLPWINIHPQLIEKGLTVVNVEKKDDEKNDDDL